MFRQPMFVMALMLSGFLSAAACDIVYALTAEDADVRQQEPAVSSWRDLGPAGLELALQQYDELAAQIAAHPDDAHELRERLRRCREVVDQAAGQRHAATSRLFWYTNLEQAQRQAAAEEKPILSLRMLGRLTDEFSCANSRFFRTALYANQEISDALRERFVLHWQSVRPAPKVTIDFGDGRILERTITGNSAHYVLTTDGRPLDVLPGLYSPHRFLQWLDVVQALHTNYVEADDEARPQVLARHHAQRLASTTLHLRGDLQRIGRTDVLDHFRTLVASSGLDQGEHPTAWEAEPVAVTKAAVEIPLLRLTRLGGYETAVQEAIDHQLWQQIAALHREGVKLDDSTVRLIRQQHPSAVQASELAVAKSFVEDPILRVVRNFEESIALDTVRNEYVLHRRIHTWFARGEVAGDFDALNERVYAELFLTPSSDPWLGLVSPDKFTALQDGGQSVPQPR